VSGEQPGRVIAPRGLVLRVADLLEFPAGEVRAVAADVVPADVTYRVSDTKAGSYLTVEMPLPRWVFVRRPRAIRYLQGVVKEIRRRLESGHGPGPT
jgi:hypothetical protein